jgi:heme/copper-type cytochrome/quinol oxidase subunit 3
MIARALDVSDLPTSAFGPRTTLWWGMLTFLAIEGTVLAMLVVTYLYLWIGAPAWPPGDTAPPGLGWATLNAALLLASTPLAYVTDRAARREDHRRTLGLMVLMVLAGLASTGLRALEFTALNVSWDANAYGSILWTILGVHLTHIVAETLENVLLVIVFCCGRREPKHFVDVHVNMVYWYFVAGAWVVLYGLVNLLPRL